jgi:hypothetical protein
VIDADALRLPEALPPVRVGRFNQHHAGNLVRIAVGEHPYSKTAQRVPHQNVRPSDTGVG